MLTLNDPQRRNAMTVGMGEALGAALGTLADRADLRAIVLTGTPPAFSGGGDLDMLRGHARAGREDGADASEEMVAFYERFLQVRSAPVPVIAAVNGHAVGAGLCVALACDLRIVADEARVGLNFARLGLHPGMGGSYLLPKLVGRERGAELLYTGRLVSGTEAASFGLALESRPSTEVLPRAMELARDIAASAPSVVRQLKQTLMADDRGIGDHIALEASNQAENYRSQDLDEGLRAVAERRQPVFTGS